MDIHSSMLARLTTTVRILAYRPEKIAAPEGDVKVVVQKVSSEDPRRIEEAEHPLLSAMMSKEEFETFLAKSRNEGWLVLDVSPSAFSGET